MLHAIDTETCNYQRRNWSFLCKQKKQIASSTSLDEWRSEWKMHLPDMVYGDNLLELNYQNGKSRLFLSALSILKDRCREESFDPLLVDCKQEVCNGREFEVYSDGYNWAFPSYVGLSGYDDDKEQETTKQLPMEILQRRDPILWSQSFLLFEDNLHDFGYTLSECRIRVMSDFFYILVQQFLRIDNQFIYTISNRYYCSFEGDSILRSFSVTKLDWSMIDSNAIHSMYNDIRNVNLFQSKAITVKEKTTLITLCTVCNKQITKTIWALVVQQEEYRLVC